MCRKANKVTESTKLQREREILWSEIFVSTLPLSVSAVKKNGALCDSVTCILSTFSISTLPLSAAVINSNGALCDSVTCILSTICTSTLALSVALV